MGHSCSQNLRMSATLRFLLLFTLLVSCLSAPKFHLIETEDDQGEEGEVDEVGSGQEGDADEGEEGGADQLGGNQEDGEDADYNSSRCGAWPLCDLQIGGVGLSADWKKCCLINNTKAGKWAQLD